MRAITNYHLPFTKLRNLIRKSKIENQNSAFTLIEILLVIAVVSIILTGVLGAYVNLLSVSKNTEYYSAAYKALDSKVEDIRNSSFADLENYPTTFTVNGIPSGTGTVAFSETIDGATQTTIKQVDITISWNFKKAQQIKTTTLITRGGLR